MRDPILRVRHPIQRRTLDINTLVLRVKIDIPNRRHIPRLSVPDTHLLKKRWRDEIHILPRIRIQPHHNQGLKAAHRARVVVARDPGHRIVEQAGDVLVCALCALGGPPGVVV